jgi:hypothetical protein
MKATNRQFEELHPDKQIKWWRSKDTYCYHLSQANKIKEISPQKISIALGIDMEIDKGYCEHLCSKVEEFRKIRRANSIKSRHTDKENKKIVLKKLLREHPATSRKRLLEMFNDSSDYKLSRNRFFILLKEIETEKKRPQEIQITSNFCNDLTMFLDTKRMLKEIDFNELPNYLKGNYKKMNSLLKNINLDFLIYSYSFEFTNGTHFSNKSFIVSEDEINNSQRDIDRDIDGLDLFYDITSDNFYEKAGWEIEYITQRQNEVDIARMMIRYKQKLIAKGVI